MKNCAFWVDFSWVINIVWIFQTSIAFDQHYVFFIFNVTNLFWKCFLLFVLWWWGIRLSDEKLTSFVGLSIGSQLTDGSTFFWAPIQFSSVIYDAIVQHQKKSPMQHSIELKYAKKEISTKKQILFYTQL